MKNRGQMMKQAQEMQARMQALQERLELEEVSGASGGGMVSVVLNGKGLLRRIKIDPSLVAPDDVEMLEDLIVAAFNDAKAKVEAMVSEKMSELTGGIQLPPGFKMPF
jgi:DNA-binding YbaB/EbfC family protein